MPWALTSTVPSPAAEALFTTTAVLVLVCADC